MKSKDRPFTSLDLTLQARFGRGPHLYPRQPAPEASGWWRRLFGRPPESPTQQVEVPEDLETDAGDND